MTIAGQLSVTASDDPRFKAGDSIGIVIDAGLDVVVKQNVEVSAPVVAVPVAPTATTPTPSGTTTPAAPDVTPVASSEAGTVTDDEGPGDDDLAAPDATVPATA
jgi:outer membrane protein W